MPRRCRQCRSDLPKLKDCTTAYQKQNFCGQDCMIAYGLAAGRRLLAKRKAQEDRAHREQKRKHKENDYAHQFKLTKKAAQKLANTLDRDLGCISCGCPRTVQFCGGHFRTVGAHRELALDLRNIHGQCNRNCNMGLSGNIAGTKRTRGFRAGLLERYGEAFVDFLESAHQTPRLTAQDLIAIRKEYAAETRRLEQGLPPSKDWRALPDEWQKKQADAA